MNRSRSKSRLFETAFVTQAPSSSEDLDEIDRLANHPVLRHDPVPESYRFGNDRRQNRSWRPFASSMRKSRSEMGAYGSDSGGGFSTALSQPMLEQGSPAAAMNRNVGRSASSYTPPAEFGCRTVAVGMMRGNGSRLLRGNLSRMKRSTTVNFQQFYSSQSSQNSDENASNNVNQNNLPHDASNRISSISGYSLNQDVKHISDYITHNSPSPASSYWSNWTDDGKNNANGTKQTKQLTSIGNSFDNTKSSTSNFYNDGRSINHHISQSKPGIACQKECSNNISSKEDGEVIITSAIVENHNAENLFSNSLEGSNDR